MNKADKNFIDAMNYIFENGVYDVNPRPYWLEEDGSHTPAHTLFAFDWKNVYDLSKNEFPFMTLRPMAWKTGVKELLWIFQDQSNDINLPTSFFDSPLLLAVSTPITALSIPKNLAPA